jgi:uncharacterized protein
MLGQLNEDQINNLLLGQVVGRLACTDGMHPYIVPLTYCFDGAYIYGQTHEGMKLSILRKNPNVCFEVDQMTDMANWQSVIVTGRFEELSYEDAEKARSVLFTRVMPLMTSSTIHQHEHSETGELDDTNRIKPIMYRIVIKDKTGRFEKR